MNKKNVYVELEQKMELEPLLYINFFKKFKHKLKLETFDHITFLYKVHELLLIIHKASAGFL